MATPGQEISTALGERYKFLDTAQSTNGEMVRYEFWLPPQKSAPPPHFHLHQDEGVNVLDGNLKVQLAGKERVLKAGETLIMRRGELHLLWNSGDVAVHALAEIRPALKWEQFLEDYVHAGRASQPGVLQLAVTLRVHRDTTDFKSPLSVILPFGHFEAGLANYRGPGILPAISVGAEDRWASDRQRLRNGLTNCPWLSTS